MMVERQAPEQQPTNVNEEMAVTKLLTGDKVAELRHYGAFA
jgi:hypothetical protein